MKVIDCTLAELEQLPRDQQENIITIGFVLKPDAWGTTEITLYEWGKVKEMQEAARKYKDLDMILNMICIAKDMKKEELYNYNWRKLFAFFNYLAHGLEHINKLEKLLEYEPTSEEVRAGIEDFDQFGYFVTIDRLAGGDPLKYDAIVKLPFDVIYSKLLLSKTDAIFQKRYHEVLKQKYK
jgi:hypothetical protein